MVQFNMDSKDKDNLVGHLDDLKYSDKDSLEKCSIHHDIADLYLKDSKFEDARLHYQDALEICKVNKECRLQVADLYTGLGESLLGLEQYAKAEENTILALLEVSIKDSRDTNGAVKLLYTLGKIYRMDNRVNASKKMVSMALPISENVRTNVTTHHVIDILNEMAIAFYSKQQLKLSNRLFIGIIEARKRRFGNQDFKASRFMTSYGEMLRVQGKDEEALAWYIDAMNIRKSINTLESTKDSRLAVADSYANLGLVYRAQGKFDDAETYLMNALDIRREELNGRGSLVGSTLNNVAELYRDRGQFGQALMFHETAINTFQACLANDHPNIVNARGNLGVTLRHQARSGNLTGEDLIKSAVKFLKDNDYKDDHPWVKKFKMEIYYSKANELSEDGDYDKAIELYKVLIESKRFSVESRITKMILKELWITQCKKAVFLRDQGCYNEAKSLFRACMDDAENHVESDDSIMCEYTFAQAENLRQMGLTEDAMELYNVLMKIRTEQFGEEHALIARLKNALAICEMEKGNYLESKSLFKQALEIITSAIENENDTFFVDKFNYCLKGHILSDFSELNRRMSSYFKAKDKQDQALELKMSYYGIHSNEVADSYYLNAKILYSIGRLESAETFNNKAYDIWNHIFDDPNHPKIANSFILSAQIDIENGRSERARASAARAMKVYEGIFPPEYPAVVFGIYITGKALMASGMHRQAEKCFQRAHEISSQTIGKFSTLAGLCSYSLGVLQSAIGNYATAGKHYRDALTIQQKSLGKYHPDYFETLIAKADNQRKNCQFSDAVVEYEEAEKFLDLRDTAYANSSTRSETVELNSKEKLPIYATFIVGKARLELEMCEFSNAQKLLAEALELRKVMYGEGHQHVHAVIHLQHECMRMSGQNITDLKGMYTENIVCMSRLWGDDHLCIAQMNVDRANFRVNYNQTNVKTRANFLEASYIAIRCLGKSSVFYADIMVSLGQMMVQDEHYSEAEQYFKEAREIYENTVGPTHGLYGILLNNLSELARFKREDDEADRLNKEAMDVIIGAYGEHHPITMNIDGNSGLIAMHSDTSRADGIKKVKEIHNFFVQVGFGEDHPWVVKFQEAMDAAETDNMSLADSSSLDQIDRDADSVERMVGEMEDLLDMRSAEVQRLLKVVEEKEAMLEAASQMEKLFTEREAENTKEIEELRKNLANVENKGIEERKKHRDNEYNHDKEARIHKQLVRTATGNEKYFEQQKIISELEEKLVFLENKIAMEPKAEIVSPDASSSPAADDDKLQLTITLALNLKNELEETKLELADINEELMNKMEENNRMTRKLQAMSMANLADDESIDTVGTAGEEIMLIKEENTRMKRHLEEMKVRDAKVKAANEEALAAMKADLDKSAAEIEVLKARPPTLIEATTTSAAPTDDHGQMDLLTSLSLHLKQDLDAAMRENSKLTEDVKGLQKQLLEMPPQVDNVPDHEDIKKLQQELDSSTSEIAQLKEQLKSQEVTAPDSSSSAQCENLAKQVHDLQEELKERPSRESLTDATSEAEKLAGEVTECREEIEKLKAAHDQEAARHASEMSGQESAYATLQANLAMLQGDDTANKLQEALSDANAKVKSMTTENADLLRDLQIKQAEVVDGLGQLEKLTEELADMKSNLESCQTELATSEEDRFTTQQYNQVSDNKIEELNASLAECCKARELLDSEVADLKQAKDAVEEDLVTTQANAAATVGELNSEIDALKAELSALLDSEAKVKSELEKTVSEQESLEGRLHAEQISNKENKEKNANLTEKLSDTNTSLKKSAEKIEKLTEDIEDFARKRSNFESLIAHLKAEGEAKDASIKNLLETIKGLEAILEGKNKEIRDEIQESQNVRDEVVIKRKLVDELQRSVDDLQEKLTFSINQRKNMDPWGFRKEAELGFNRFDTRLRTPKEEKTRQPDIARHFESASPIIAPMTDDQDNEFDEEDDPVISSHVDDLMLGSVPSRHFTGAKDLYAKGDQHRFVSREQTPMSPILPDIYRRPSQPGSGTSANPRTMVVHASDNDATYDDDSHFEIETPSPSKVEPPGSAKNKKQNLSKSQPVPNLMPVSPIGGAKRSADSPATNGSQSVPKNLGKQKKERSKRSSAQKGSTKKDLNPIIERNKKLAATCGAGGSSAPSSTAKSPEQKAIPVIKRVNNYVEVYPVVKKFGVYGCLDSTKVAIDKSMSSSRSVVPKDSRDTKDLGEIPWPEELSIMDSVRLDSADTMHSKDTFKVKPSGLW